jgi:hypothetical protein
MRSPDNSAAIKEQSKARKLSEAQFKEQMAFMQKQSEMAGGFQMPDMKPPSPPTSASPDVFEAGQEQRRRSARRFGFAKTTMKGETRATAPMGGASTLGGAKMA